jgi:cation diffusion facilitator CzcD-associated flavoprotein CzcO
MNTAEKYAIIGGGPSGLAGAKNLKDQGIPFDLYEAASEIGGLWNINNEYSTVYESAHLISSKRLTEFHDFPMKENVADYPHHSELLSYFKDYASHFGLYGHFRLNTRVKRIEPVNGHWELTTEGGHTSAYKGIIIANGCLSHPNMPEIPGEYTGELLHSCKYKTAAIFDGKRVLVVGAGNSGCDIAVDAVHRAGKVDLSVRRGYHFVPKYLFGRPADTIGGAVRLPAKVKQKFDHWLLNTFFVVNPQKLGFPAPDHKLYESHPIVNTLVLHHLGHGDISIKKDVRSFDGKTVHFKDGTSEDYDMVILATGYKLNYPFIDRQHLNWPVDEKAPRLYLNIFTPDHDNLFVLGMIEATGLGWEGRNKQAELVAHYIRTARDDPGKAARFHARFQDRSDSLKELRGGYNYMEVDRMAYYVHKDTYLRKMRRHLKMLN